VSLLQELQRRNVFRVALGYIVSCWLLAQVADFVLDNIGAPDWVIQTIMLVLALGFPVVVFFAWAYEVTPEGIKRESAVDRTQSITHVTARKLDRAIIAVLLIAVGYFILDKVYLSRTGEAMPTQAQVQPAAEPGPGPAQVAADPTPSIAVLPFVNMSEDASNEYFSDGLSEEILNLLAKVSGLKVIARTSSFAFKGKNQDLREVGDALGVRNVLEGSVRKSGERVRITAQLINVEDGAHIWSESYDRTLTDIFAIQDDVAAAIVDALKIHVGNTPNRGRPTESIAAYDLFLQAKSFWRSEEYSEVSFTDAAASLRAAIELDPQFAEAYEQLAAVYWNMAGTYVKAGEGQRLTYEAAGRALELDPDLTLARALYRSADLENYSWAGEIEAFEQGLQKQPSNIEMLDALAFDLMEAGYFTEAAQYAERQAALDPLARLATRRYAESLVSLGRLDEALPYGYPVFNGRLFLLEGRLDQAAEEFAAIPELKKVGGYAPMRDVLQKIRNPQGGQEYLDEWIANMTAGMPDDLQYNLWASLVTWYPAFGYLDRYFEIIGSVDLESSTWTDADWLIYTATVERLYNGFTAHPGYLKMAEYFGLIDLWDQRGPPDYCHKEEGAWVCE